MDRCDRDNPRGLCEYGEECYQGRCEESRSFAFSGSGLDYDDRYHHEDEHHRLSGSRRRCSSSSSCPSREVCTSRGLCADECSRQTPLGGCEGAGERCDRGRCVFDEDGHLDHFHDSCDEDRQCHNGQECILGRCEDQPCSGLNPDGRCPRGRVCSRGVCVREGREEPGFPEDLDPDEPGGGVIVGLGKKK